MNKFRHLLGIILLTLAFQLILVFSQYCGNFYWILWPSDFFNPPKEVIDNNNGPFMEIGTKIGGVGWDGQFYYLMSRDPLMLGQNFKEGIDTVPYRYQRVGLSLVTKLTSLILGQESPSPFLYWLVNNLVFIIGLILLSQIFYKAQIHQSYLWLWGLGVGTQSVLFHGLPDAFADSFFIGSFFMMFNDRWRLSALLAVVTVLSRETYVTVYGVLFLFWVINKLLKTWCDKFVLGLKLNELKFKSQGWVFIFPCLTVLGWQLYIFNKTGNLPSSGQLGVLLDFPLRAALLNLGSIYLAEVVMTLFFIIITMYTAYLLLQKPFKIINLAFIPITILISSMGPGVFGLFRDYLKGLSPLLIIIPFLISGTNLILIDRFKKIISLFIILQPIFYFGIKFKELKYQRQCLLNSVYKVSV